MNKNNSFDMTSADLSAILTHRAEMTPQRQSHTLLHGSAASGDVLSYETLRTRAWGVAAALRGRVQPGERALLLYASPLEFMVAFMACLDMGVIAVPAPPPETSRLKRSLPRLLAIVADCDAALILADGLISTAIGQMPKSGLNDLPLVDTSVCVPAQEAPGPVPDASVIAYLQYTSGSTGQPKGIMISRGALRANLAYCHQLWRYNTDSQSVNWMPYYHDFGLVEGLLQPLYAGIPAALMSPTAFLRAPVRWLRAISELGGTHAASPNFGYAYCVDRISESDREGLDLSSWRVASNGAEIVRWDTLNRFAQTYAANGFRKSSFVPSYGMAEATLLLTATRETTGLRSLTVNGTALGGGQVQPDETGITFVGCGTSGPNTQIAIVDPDNLAVLGDAQLGEIWARGPGIGTGYWNRPDAGEAVFSATTAQGETGYLRTGDLGFFQGGQLFVTGRIKDMIVIRGANYFPQDIETTVRLADAALARAECAAFAFDQGGTERLGLVIEADKTITDDRLADLYEAVAAIISEVHEIQLSSLVFTYRGGLPKTSSGKVQRGRCRAFLAEAAFDKLRAQFPSSPGKTPPARPADSRARADAIIAHLRSYGRDRINFTLQDERRSFTPNTVLDFGNMGVLGLQAPPDEGGQGLLNVDFVRVLEQIGAMDLSLGVFTVLQNGLGLYPLLRHARPEQRAALLPPLATGRELISFAYTEQGAGSNVRAIATEARRQPDGTLRLSGTKYWSGSSAWATQFLVFARETEVNGQPLGISAFVLGRGRPGLRTDDEALTMGLRTTIQNKVLLSDVPVTDGDRLGKPGQGLDIAQDAMSFTRLCLAALGLGALKRLVRIMHGFAQRRVVITGPLAQHALTRGKLSHWSAAVTGLETLVSETAQRADSKCGAHADLYAACKALAPEMLWQAADDCVQMLGGRGYMEHNLVAMIFRDARAFRIFEGPTESIYHHLGSRALNAHGEVERTLANDLGNPAVAARLGEIIRQTDAAFDPELYPFRANGGLRARKAQGLGEATAWAILAACVGARHNDDPDNGELTRAVHWCDARLDDVARRAATASFGEIAALGEKDLNDLVASYGTDIGPPDYVPPVVEQLPEIELSPQAPSPVARNAPAPAQTRHNDPSVAVQTLENWVVAWLVRTLDLEAGDIDTRKAFASFGLDSVTANMLAMDLESHLARPVDATLIWDYPSIGALCAHLAEGPDDCKPGQVPPVDKPISAADDLDKLLSEIGDV
ncbi:AMP-binding protein [Roseovarius aestuarii]|nr:AMP-binding protein [Roseovarius aestuarii]